MIQDIKQTDIIPTFNEKNQQVEMNVVTNLFKKTARKLQRLVVGADTLWTTPEHPFFSNNKWINAAMLTAGMVLQSPFGSDTVKANVPVNDTSVTVYNFTVENNHNYYVGKGNYLVHNSCERISTLTNGLTDPALKSAFTNALASNKNFADAIINGTVNIQDWVTLTKALGANSKIATDLKTLQKVKQIRNNADFSNALGNNALEEIIRGNNRASCATCQTAGTAAAKNMDEYLEDVEHFFNEFKNSTTDYLEVLAELRKAPSTSQNAAFDRAAEVIDHLNKNRQINKNAVQKFGGRFDIDVNVIDNCPNCSFFIELKNGQKIRLGVQGAGTLSDNLPSSLRVIYDDMLSAGYSVTDDGFSILFKNSENISIAKISDGSFSIKIPDNHISGPWAKQSSSADAVAALNNVKNDSPLYRIGTINHSSVAEAQYWSLENPLDIIDINVFASKYGIPIESVSSGDFFVVIAKPKVSAPFITREAPGIGSNSGGSIEVVVPVNGVTMESFHTINF